MMKALLILCLLTATVRAEEEVRKPAAVSTMEAEELVDFDKQPEPMQKLIREALLLTKMKLTYVFSSSDPKLGGMDCSGTIYHLLQKSGRTDTPRQSDEMCGWVQAKSTLYCIEKADSPNHAEFVNLKPGDLLFWSGTYESTKRKIPVTHVMLYLGKNKSTGKPVIFGASDGRSFEGQKRTGVSVFDFVLPKAGGKTSFYGYGSIPQPATSPASSPPLTRRRSLRP